MRRIVALAAVLAAAACAATDTRDAAADDAAALTPVAATSDTGIPGLTPLPRYVFADAVAGTARNAVLAGGQSLTGSAANLRVRVDGRIVPMRVVEFVDGAYAVAEGAIPSDALAADVRRRSGCAVIGQPEIAEGAVVYRLGCQGAALGGRG